MSYREGKPVAAAPPRSAPRRAAFSAFDVRPSQLTGVVLDNRYKIHGYLSGSTSRVYLAEDLQSSAPVVVKMLAPEAARNAALRQRILEQAREAVAVRHPNVIDILGVGQTPGGLPYLIMEALAGQPLIEVLRQSEKLPTDLALVLARQAAAGLSAMHRAGILHRHLKPSNLLVLGAPEQPYGLKLLDYGMAKGWESTAASNAHTLIGTIEYMAPEEILAEHADERSDIYSFGILLFQLFTGHVPFESTAGPVVLRHQLFSQVPPPSWLDDGIDPGLEAIILNATRKNPDNRYPSVQTLADDLDISVGLISGRIELRPLQQSPDVYLPRTDRGRDALEMLSRKFAEADAPDKTSGG